MSDLAATFEATSHGVVIADDCGNVRYVNSPARTLLGMEPATRDDELQLDVLPHAAASSDSASVMATWTSPANPR
jgi:sensor histidine kinase regulating citrate/malate metabolism